jgi:tetratricopeptide (TPR) repeat protein
MPPPRLSSLPAANKIFVNREGPLRVFENAALGIPADSARLLTFYGIGGQGKTALCRELMQKTKSDPSYRFLRRAELDLHGKPKTDPDLLLVWIRNGFADAGVALPCFDLALAIVWEATRGEQPFPKLSRAWLGKAKDFAGEGAAGAAKVAQESLGETIEHLPAGFLVKKLSGWIIDKAHHAYLHQNRGELQELYRDGELKKPYELSELLPWMLAQDLNYHLAHHPDERFVLLIDEYERVFDEGSAGSLLRENPFDRHLRTFVRETNGLLAVFFSRERLPWENGPEWRAALQGAQYLLGGLSGKDADAFLQAIPISDAPLRKAMVEGARETSANDAAIYPLMLDLQVEHWRALIAQDKPIEPATFSVMADDFAGRRREIVDRVLRDYGQPMQKTLMRLSCARRFDRAAFEHIVKTFHTGLPLDAFDTIDDLSFLTKNDGGFVSMHGIMADAIREMLDRATQTATLQAIFEHFDVRAKVASPRDVTNQTVAALFEAADARIRISPESFSDWLGSAAGPLRMAARYTDAAVLWRQALAVAEEDFGPDDPATATSLNHLGYLLNAQGDLTGARPYYERALAIRERALGPDHPDTATSLNNLGYQLRALGNLAGARPYYERALEAWEKTLGPDHPDTATSLNNLGDLLQAQGDLARALPYFERALAIREKALGPDHPNTALSLNNLGALFDAQGNLAGARPYYERALAIREKVLGPDHPDTAISLNNLGYLLRLKGDLAGARPYYERALAVWEKTLGPDHPDTATSLNNVGALLDEQGDLAGARPYYERALAIRQKALGPDHPDTAASLNNLGYLLYAQGDLAGARPYYERALAIWEKTLGPDHPNTAATLNNIGALLDEQGDLAGAWPYYERALAIREKALGPDHPDTASSLNNLGYLLRLKGDLAGARPCYERALAICMKALGPDHPTTTVIRGNLEKLDAD